MGAGLLPPSLMAFFTTEPWKQKKMTSQSNFPKISINLLVVLMPLDLKYSRFFVEGAATNSCSAWIFPWVNSPSTILWVIFPAPKNPIFAEDRSKSPLCLDLLRWEEEEREEPLEEIACSVASVVPGSVPSDEGGTSSVADGGGTDIVGNEEGDERERDPWDADGRWETSSKDVRKFESRFDDRDKRFLTDSIESKRSEENQRLEKIQRKIWSTGSFKNSFPRLMLAILLVPFYTPRASSFLVRLIPLDDFKEWLLIGNHFNPYSFS